MKFDRSVLYKLEAGKYYFVAGCICLKLSSIKLYNLPTNKKIPKSKSDRSKRFTPFMIPLLYMENHAQIQDNKKKPKSKKFLRSKKIYPNLFL